MSVLFQRGDFLLHSGERSLFKIECDALTLEDWQTLAEMLVERLSPFATVEGVPRGGLTLADMLEPYCVPEAPDRLIVDDVWTTGGSMRAHKEQLRPTGIHTSRIRGAVVFARNQPDRWVKPLFSLSSP